MDKVVFLLLQEPLIIQQVQADLVEELELVQVLPLTQVL
tara:strand:+ start:169 stop:285 length:117 start_codon:yes stop_codon:yes gene_type:complete